MPKVRRKRESGVPKVAFRKDAPAGLSETRQVQLICLALLVVTLIVYMPVFRNGFINYDDDVYVAKNSFVKDGLTAKGLVWAFNVGYAGNWHPLTWMSHMVDSRLFDSHAGGHHATSLLLHLANAILLFLVLRRMTGSMWKSAFVAALFALHPLHVESVAWVAERKDVLSALFWILAMGAYVLYTERPGVGRYLAVVALFGLGLMAKPMVISLPIILILLDYWPLRRTDKFGWGKIVLEKIPLLVMSAGSAIITFIAQQREGAVAPLDEFSVAARVSNAVVSYVSYIGKAIYPLHLAIFYPYANHLPIWQVIGSGVLLAAATIAAIHFGRKRRYLTVGWLWFVITLIPVIGLVQVGRQAMADRYTYVPLIGIFIIAAMGASDLAGEKKAKKSQNGATLPTLAVAVLLALAVLAGRQAGYWRNSETLFQHAVDVTKDNYSAHINLGLAFDEEGRFDDAISQFQKSLAIKRDSDVAHFSLGGAYMDHGQLDAAADEFRTAIKIKPTYAMAHYNLGLVYTMQGIQQAAMKEYTRALEISPNMAPAHDMLGAALGSQGRVDEAIKHFRKAIEIEPGLAMAHYNLGVALASQGKTGEAVSEYRKSILKNPDYPNAYYSLGQALEQQGKPDEAATEYRNALEVDQQFQLAAIALQRLGKK